MRWAMNTMVAFGAIASIACSGNGGHEAPPSRNAGAPAETATVAPAPAQGQAHQAAGAADRPAAATSASSILAWSRPVAGSTVNGPVDELQLHFSPPARLDEVTVSGPDGAMPMMVTAVGEVAHYSLPVPGLEPGRYTVDWRASAGGTDHRGRFGFQVR
ncbi:MAG: copper resistance protein CopC [Sphingomonas sp.]|nr:copper resistance protein CopC [Sphingomonas sp.]